MVARRWPNGVECPTCGNKEGIGFLAKQNRWQCRYKHPKRQFSLKTGTIFEDSPLGLDKWLMTMWLIGNCKNGVSSYEIARDIHVTQKSARTVADYIIAFSQEHGDAVSNLKLQKLLYYAQAWYLALNDHALFDERIEAWVHGPAVPPVYGEFKQWSWQPINVEGKFPEMREEVDSHLRDVMDSYGGFSAYQLEQMTHDEDPWKIAGQGIAPDEASNVVISHDSMRRYYRARLDGSKQD